MRRLGCRGLCCYGGTHHERNAAIAEATTAGHTAQEGTQAFALQGNSVESADFKTQSFGALVVKLGTVVDAVQPHADAVQATANDAMQGIATTHILKNTDSDAYLEKTQWVSATDAQGKTTSPSSYVGDMVASIGQEGTDMKVGLSDGRNILTTDIVKWLAI